MRRMIGVFGGLPHAPEGMSSVIGYCLRCPGCNHSALALHTGHDGALHMSPFWRVYNLHYCDALPWSGGNPDSNTLLSDMTTVVCLDDYHCLDRFGRKEKGVTALDPKAQDFELMYQQVKDIKENKPISKPIYNHVTGLLDPEETVKPPKVSALLQHRWIDHCCFNTWQSDGGRLTAGRCQRELLATSNDNRSAFGKNSACQSLLESLCRMVNSPLKHALGSQIMVLEGLHPFYDERVRELYDFRIYLDISDEVKFAWKIQRDMKERGHSLESIKASIEARRPDFDAYIDPQKKHADVIIQVRAFRHALACAHPVMARVCPALPHKSCCSMCVRAAGVWRRCGGPSTCVKGKLGVCRCCRHS